MIILYILCRSLKHHYNVNYSHAGILLRVGAELVVESEKEITRERLIKEAKLVKTILKPTDCDTVTEKVDYYEVIINKNGKVNEERIALGKH